MLSVPEKVFSGSHSTLKVPTFGVPQQNGISIPFNGGNFSSHAPAAGGGILTQATITYQQFGSVGAIQQNGAPSSGNPFASDFNPFSGIASPLEVPSAPLQLPSIPAIASSTTAENKGTDDDSLLIGYDEMDNMSNDGFD